MTNFGKVPDASDFSAQEPTPVTNIQEMYRAVAQTKSVVRRLFQVDMPQIAKDARHANNAATEAGQQVMIVRSRQEDLVLRLERMEKAGHPCVQKDALKLLNEQSVEWRLDKEEGIRTREMVKSAQEDITKAAHEIVTAKDAPKRILLSVLAVGIGMITAVVGVAWSLSGSLTSVEASIAMEHAVREAQLDGIKERLGQLPTKQNTPTKAQVETLQKTVTENGHSFADRCKRLTPQQKSQLDRQVLIGMLPLSFRCPD